MILLQLTNQKLNPTSRILIDAIRLCFNDLKVFVGTQQKNAKYPQGHIDVSEKLNIRLPMLKRKQLKEILLQIHPDEPIVITDLLSPLLFTPAQLDTYNVIHLISELPCEDVLDALSVAYQKRSGQMTIVAASETIKQKLAGVVSHLDNIHVLYPPYLDTPTIPSQPDKQSFIVGVIQLLMPEQGIEAVIQALHRNQELLPQLNLIISGDGPEKRRLLWLIDHLHLRKRIQIVSAQDNFLRFLPNFDVLVAPSPQPVGWDPVLIHALAHGLPVIAAKTGVRPEIIEHGHNGLLFEPGNSHTLSQHLLNLYNNPDWMDHYKKTGPRFVADRFSINSFKSKFDSIL